MSPTRFPRRLAAPIQVLLALAVLSPGSSMAIGQTVGAQVVVAPQADGAALRARFAFMAKPGRPMPPDAADLDAMLVRGDVTSLAARLRGAHAAQDVAVDLNWEQTKLYDGAGFIIAYAYLYDLWRFGSLQPGASGDQIKQTAGMIFLYALDLVRLDGVRCADVSAPGHRQDQLFGQNQPLIAYLRTLPRDRRMTLGTISLALEAATAPMRKDDAVLCSGGLDEIGAGLKANGSRPLPQVPTPPGVVGKTYSVPAAPGYAPRFVAAEAWRPKQSAIRQSLPAGLTNLLTMSADGASTGAR